MPSNAKKREKQKKKKADKQRQQKSQIPDKSKLEKTDDKSNVTVDKTEETKVSGDSGDKAPQLYETASGAEGHELLYQRVPQINENRTGATIIIGKQDKPTGHELLYQRVPQINENRTGATIIIGKQDKPTVQKKTTMAQANKSITEEMNQTENKNWVKAGLCFYEVKEVLLDFVAGDWTEPKPAADCDISPILTFVIDFRKYQQQQFGGRQKSAKTVRRDRNDYIHERPQPKVTDKELNEFKRNILNLLKNQMLQKTGKTERAKRRIDEICKEEYIIIPKDEYSARLSYIEGKLDTIEMIEKKKIAFLAKEIKDVRDLLEKFECSGDNSELETKFQTVETDLKEMISKLTVRVDKVEADLKETKSKLTVQVDKLESQVGEMMDDDTILQEAPRRRKRPESDGLRQLKKTATNRRPESDGLRQLKSQTEDKLDTVRTLGCIPTTLAAEAKKLLEEKRSVVIKGNPGEGKTRTALHLIDDEMYRERRVVVYCPTDWKTVDTDWVDIVVLEDILGKYGFDHARLQEWMVYLPTIQEHVDAGKLQVIITTQVDILAKADSKLGSLKLFSDHLSLTLSSEHLSNSEKMNILNREIQRHNKKNMKEDEIEKCITNFNGLIGFPQCCLLFAADSKLFDRGPEFFKSPKEFFFINIHELEAEKFISLAFLFCHGMVYEDYLSPETMPKPSNDLFMELAADLHISKKKADIKLLRDAYEHFEGMYIEKLISYEIEKGDSDKRSCFWFSHATVWEAVGQVLAKHSLEMVVKHGDPEYLYQRTYTAEVEDKTSEKVFLPVSMYLSMAERIVHDVVENTLVKSAGKHSVLKQNQFLMKLKDVLHKGNRIKDFFMASPYSKLRFISQELSEGECFTFLQYLLQSDEVTVKLVYSHLMEFLVCTHNNNSAECWQCKEKQNLLELALYYHHFEIADKLIAMNAHYTHVSLCNAARHGDLSRVQTVMDYLKSSLIFNPEGIEAQKALCRAYLSRSQDVIEILLQEEITLDSMHVVDAVQHGDRDINVLIKVVEHLKDHSKWHPHSDQKSNFGCFFQPYVYPDQFEEAYYQLPCAKALYIAYCIENFDMADYLLKNEAKVSLKMLVSVTKYSTKEAVARVIQHLKVNYLWDPNCDDASQALGEAYGAQKYDVCDLLVQEGVSMTMKTLHCLVRRGGVSLKAVTKVVTCLKVTDSWDPKCYDASKVLEEVSRHHNYDVCDLLIEEGVLPTMKYTHHVILRSLDDVKRAVKQLKDTDSWYPQCNDASEALAIAYRKKKYDVCDLLIQEGVSLTMKNLPSLCGELEAVKKAVQHLKDTNNWDPKCEDVYGALGMANMLHKYDVCELLVQEGVSVTMKHVPHVILESLNYVKKVVMHLKKTGIWDPKCDDASEGLAKAYSENKYDVCDLLIQEGVSLTMKNLPLVVKGFNILLEAVKKAVEHLKGTNNWNPKCEDASEALLKAYSQQKYDVCDLLIQEGASLTMENFPCVDWVLNISLESVKKVVQHFKHTNSWDSKCEDASKVLEEAYRQQKYDVCDLLIQEGVSLRMKNLPDVVYGLKILKAVKKAVQHLKDTGNWDSKCMDASHALDQAYMLHNYDVCDLLVQEGVSVTMKHIPYVILKSLDDVKRVVKQLKETDSWDPQCDDASKALAKAYSKKKYDVCDLLSQEGVSVRMNHVPYAILKSLDDVKKVVKQLKETDSWDPQCDDASEALAKAYRKKKYDVCDLLIQEGVSLTMKNLPSLYGELEAVKKAVQHLKDTNNWDPKCEDASKALEKAYREQKYDVCDLLIQEGASLTMKNLVDVGGGLDISLEAVKKVVQHLKDTHNWDPKCEEALKALEEAYRQQKYDVCDLLIQEGVSLTMKNLPHVVWGFGISLKAVQKVVKHLKDTDNWDPKCNDASKALEDAYGEQKYDVCDLLNWEGVSLTMKNIPGVVYHVSLEHVKKVIQQLHSDAVCDQLIQDRDLLAIKNHYMTRILQVPLETVKKAIEHLKDHENWDAKSDEASEALANAYSAHLYDVCDLLLGETVSLTMKYFPGVVVGFVISLEAVKKAMQHLKVTDNWDPKCDDASKALANAYNEQKYDVCDLLIQEGVSLTMQTLDGVVEGFHVSLEAVKKALRHLKDTDNWNPSSEHASKALENAYVLQKYDVCDLLIQEGVSLSMKNVPGVVYSVSMKYVKKAIQHLNKYDLFDLLVLKRASLAVKNLPCVEGRSQVSLEAVKKVIQHLKDTDNWDPRCDDASKALANSYSAQIYDVCDLLVKEGVLLNNEESSSCGAGTSCIIGSS